MALSWVWTRVSVVRKILIVQNYVEERAVEKCRQLQPDLLILDICLPKLNGVDAARQILKRNPSQRILVLTNVDSDQVVRDCLAAGVRGWVPKSDGVADLTMAVEALQRRQFFLSSRVSDLVMDGFLLRQGPSLPVTKIPALSVREREVVQLVAEGKTSKQLAVILRMSQKTAETHRSNIMSKLKIHSISELVLYAVRNEIVHVQLPGGLSLLPATNGRADAELQRA